MKFLYFFYFLFLCVHGICALHTQLWSDIEAGDALKRAAAHLALANRPELRKHEKFWHLRWAYRLGTPKIQKEAKKKIATDTETSESSTTNDIAEFRAGFPLLLKEPHHSKLRERTLSLYQLIVANEINPDLVSSEWTALCEHLLFPGHRLRITGFLLRTPLRAGSFGSCLCARAINALNAGIQGLVTHGFHFQMCRADYLLDAVIKGTYNIDWDNISSLVRDTEIVAQQIRSKKLGRVFSPQANSSWHYPATKKAMEATIEERLKNPESYNIILFDNYNDLKCRYARFKTNPVMKMFLRPEDVKGPFEKWFVLEEKPPIEESIRNFYQLFEAAHLRFPNAKIVFLHFSVNLSPNIKLKKRAQEFKKLFTPQPWVHVIDLPATAGNVGSSILHFKPWYYEQLATHITEILLTN